ncbi:MAG: Asp-tRNA(Asn)/Glu-tRNA(Gln) amidotransferase subunit GatA [Candidatus Nealsonbacteria bacterium]|nr:Asp-tRNA(Asn)/Glu-tRNA(Gln) amidotransferase subunit GatA [Candidatus Nealsonbacteria bacterium]
MVKKEFSALELTKAFLDEIDKSNEKIFAFLTVTRDSALSQAKRIDDLISAGQDLPLLAGIPLAVKDNIMVEGARCTASSKILEEYIAPYDATVIKKLKEQGIVILGKTNLDEFAMGASTENSAFGPTRNPHDLSRVPGGSSGGSAAAVAGNLSVCALGSDTGGSIRQPASFCGAVGLKPTYGAVSRYGLIAMASSLDQIGPITKTAQDAALVFEAIEGKDEKDSTSVNSKIKNQKSKLEFKIQNLRIGVPKEYFMKGMDKEVEKTVKNAINKLEEAGAEVREVSLPYSTDYALAAYYIIMPSEVSANLARYDGIKYGYSSPAAKNLMEVYSKSRGEGFGKEVKRRIMFGTYALSSGYYEAYYLRAQKVRTKIIEDFNRVFKSVDVIATPTAPTTAFKLGDKTKDPLSMYLADIFVTAVNLAGLPAISLPCGKIQGLPVGLQIIGRHFEEDKVLKLGEIFEKL